MNTLTHTPWTQRMQTKAFLLFASYLLAALCATAQPVATSISLDDPKHPAFAPVQEDPHLPRVLLIGDSISIGYTVDVQTLLKGKANVLRIPINGGSTQRGIEMLDAWLDDKKWDVIHFNWGLHDIRLMKNGEWGPEGEWQVSLEKYRENLNVLVAKLKATGAKLIWASTTPVPQGVKGRTPGDEIIINAAAAGIMKQHGIDIDDLHTYILPHLTETQQPANVHFNEKGCSLLAQQVAAKILEALAALPNHASGKISVQRFAVNPIICPEMLSEGDSKNINGPSLIRVPHWMPNPLGKYYLYFAAHDGKFIRMAYADDLAGPWRMYEPWVLHLDQAPDGQKHIASPDVHIDDAKQAIRMYYHSPSKTAGTQTTYCAHSSDGLHFAADANKLGPFYFRVFRYGEEWYAMAKRGWLYRSKDGLTPFEQGPNPFQDNMERDGDENTVGIRHVAVDLAGDTLYVYFTNIGDTPERIFRSAIKLTPDWTQWKADAPELILKPETVYEGADLPLAASQGGRSKARENAVRDPAIFHDEGRTYLLYSVSGEFGIAIAELIAQ